MTFLASDAVCAIPSFLRLSPVKVTAVVVPELLRVVGVEMTTVRGVIPSNVQLLIMQ